MSTNTLLILAGLAILVILAMVVRFVIRRLRLFVRSFWPHS